MTLARLKITSKKPRLIIFLAMLCAFAPMYGQVEDTVYIDFGSSSVTTPNGWNNLTLPRTGVLPDLININNLNTGITLTVTDQFNGVNSAGLTADDTLNIPASASSDSFFGNTAEWSGSTEPTGGVTLSNLEVGTPYSFAIFGSRDAGDNRQTKYTVTGSTTVADSINVAGNTSLQVYINDILPDAGGNITIVASPGAENENSYGFYYMGSVKIFFENNYVPPVKELTLTNLNGGEVIEAGNTKEITWEGLNVSELDISFSADSGVNWYSVESAIDGTTGSYDWTVPDSISDDCLISIVDVSNPTVTDTSEAVFTIIPNDGIDYTIVVLGSSTAAGGGATTLDSAWVWMYQDYLNSISTNYHVVNLAVGGYTTYKILPTGYPVPPGISSPPDPDHNITQALSLFPDAIIINLPSNDAASGFPVEDQLVNYDTIAKLADSHNVPLFVCTPQPRNLEASLAQIQFDMVDTTYSIFGDFAIDFWTDLAKTDGSGEIEDIYDAGDGIHPNNAAHKILLQRVIGIDIPTAIDSTQATNYFNVAEDHITIGWADASTGTISILTDLDWTAAEDADWFDIDVTAETGNYEMTVTASSENTGTESRSDTITFTPNGLADVEVIVTQGLQELFTLTVVGGTGGGDYEAGTSVNIAATEPAGSTFTEWTGDIIHLTGPSSSTQVIMPAYNITISANFINFINNAKLQNEISLFPNPVTDELNIRFPDKFSGHVYLYSINGAQLIDKMIENEIETINTEKLDANIYILEIRDDANETVYRGQIVKN
jgi:lysophospholipase L1-like esterase